MIRKSVIIVESSYVAKSLNGILRSTDILGDALCFATLGRLLEMSASANPLEVKTSRQVIHADIARRLMSIKNADVYVASDSDVEGELIAYDTVNLMKEQGNTFYRIDLKELTEEGLIKALHDHQPLNVHLIESCLARRGFDFALRIQGAPVGRVQARLMGSVQEDALPIQYESLLTEVSLSGKNTVSALVEMTLQGYKPLEVTYSLQKLYSQGRITYPRTMAGISPERNSLVAIESHHAIQVTKNGFRKTHYDTGLDEGILEFLDKPMGSCLTSRCPLPPSDKRDIYSLLHAYRYPHLRASTVGIHSQWLSRAMKKDGVSLTSRAWNAYYKMVQNYSPLVNKEHSHRINQMLYSGKDDHQSRIKMALEVLREPEEGSGKSPIIFEYPDIPNSEVNVSPIFE